MNFLKSLEQLLGKAENTVGDAAQNVGHAINNFSVPDSTFDPIRRVSMTKSGLHDYQYTRDKGIAESNAQQTPSGVIQAHGSYSPYMSQQVQPTNPFGWNQLKQR